MSKEPEEQSFKVTDKRLFHEDGERREADAQAEVPREKAHGTETAGESASGQQEGPAADAGHIDFPSYILSYYTQGLVLLGEVANPYTQQKEEEPEAARHTIDILTLLQEKTKGNLTYEEEQLLQSVLYELRLKYMAKTNRIKL
jgi:hypothetical protein